MALGISTKTSSTTRPKIVGGDTTQWHGSLCALGLRWAASDWVGGGSLAIHFGFVWIYCVGGMDHILLLLKFAFRVLYDEWGFVLLQWERAELSVGGRFILEAFYKRWYSISMKWKKIQILFVTIYLIYVLSLSKIIYSWILLYAIYGLH